MTIDDKLLTMGSDHGRSGVALDVQGVLVHYVGNPGSTALANRNYFESGSAGNHVSAHYIVGLNGEVLRCVPETERAAHAGKLRDLAMALSGSAKQFEVGYDGAIKLTGGKPYTPAGGALAKGDGKDKPAVKTVAKIYLDGKELNLTAYNIADSNYFKLRDIGKALNFYIVYANGVITVDTGRPYSE